MARVVLSNLSKSFGSTVAVRDLSLTIEDGEFMVLVGPSGCGKTTVLRIIAGLEQADAGDVRIGDQCVNHWEPRKRNVAMVFQNYALYPHMTVARNIGFPLKMAKVPRAERERRVLETARMLDIDDLLKRKPGTLSGGQMQRVALGRALIRDPQVFLFDEPLSNLDAKMRMEMRAELARLHKKLEATMILVTHDQAEAMTLGNRIAVLKDGVLQQVGPPLEVYNKPANRFVAGFIGSPAMNFINGIGIRPHDIVITNDGPIDAKVDLVEPMGSETHIHCLIGDQRVLVVTKDPPKAATLRLLFPDNKPHRFA